LLKISQDSIAFKVAFSTIAIKIILDDYLNELSLLQATQEIDLVKNWCNLEFDPYFESRSSPMKALAFLINQTNQSLKRNQPQKNKSVRETWVQVSFFIS